MRFPFYPPYIEIFNDIYIYTVGLVAFFNTKRLEVFPRPNELNGIE